MILTSNNSKADTAEQSKHKKSKLSGQSSLQEFLEDETLELRPQKLNQYIGQKQMTKQLSLIIESAKIRQQMPEHILFYGGPGLGKTTIASLIANELGASFKILAAPSLQKTGDLVSLLLSLETNTVLFIDEIHRLRAPLEEVLYSAMEDKKVDLLMGKGHGASVARLDVNNFILVGATTQLGKISKPLKDRFPTVFQLEPYKDTEILELIDRSSQVLKVKIDDEARVLLCMRCRGVPRIANNLLKRLLDYQVVNNVELVSKTELEVFLQEMGIFEHGLTKADISYLKALAKGSVGLKTLGGMLLEETETLELVIEPYLIYLGFVNKSSDGRQLTQEARDFLNKHAIYSH